MVTVLEELAPDKSMEGIIATVKQIHCIAKSTHLPTQIIEIRCSITSMATGVCKQAPRYADCFCQHLRENGSLLGAQ